MVLDGALRGKVAIVTGASRAVGIGAATARLLAEAGADLFLTWYHDYDAEMPWGSDPHEVQTLLSNLRDAGVRAAGVELDLGEATAAVALFDAVEAALGKADILVNNATYSTRGSIDELSAAQLDSHYRVNVRAMALLCREFVRRFGGTAGGRIINLTSGQGAGPMPSELAYVATKGAVEAFTTSASPDLIRRGITINAVDPGATDTGWMTSTFKAALEASAPSGRVGLPADAARLIRFLATDEAAWITGQIIRSRGAG